MINLLKKVVFSAISIRLLSVIISFISTILINRTLGLELRGAYTTIYTYANLLQTLLNLGVAYALVPLSRSIGWKRAKCAISTCLWLQFLICVACSLFFLYLSFSLQNLFIVVLMCLLILNGQVVFVSLIEDIRSRNTTLLVSSVLYMVSNLILMLFLKKHLYSVLLLLVAKTLFEIIACLRNSKLFHCKLSDLNCEILKEIARYGIPTAVLNFLIACNYNIDVVILNFLNVGDYELGMFGVAYTLSNMLWFIPDAFKEYVYNKSAKSASEGLTLVLIFFNMIICICICFGFLVLGKPFLVIMYGKEYAAAFPVVSTVFMGIIPMIAYKLIHPIYINNGRSLSIAVILLAAVITNCIFACALVPHFGAFGAAISTVVAYSLCGVLFFAKFVHDYGLSLADFKQNLQELINLACL